MQQSLKEFLESKRAPWYDEGDERDYDYNNGQYELAQEVLGKYFTERNFE